MAEIFITDNELVIKFSPLRALATLKRQIIVPLANLVGVTADPGVRADFPRLGQKRVGADLFGFYFGGVFNQAGQKTFWDVRKPENAVVLVLKGHQYDRIVVEVSDPNNVVALIESRILS